MAREQWTDQRMDDLNGRMEKGFDRVDADIRELRSEVGSHRNENKANFDRVDDEFGSLRAEINARFDSMQRTMIICSVTLFASIWAGVIGAVLAVLL